METVYQILKMFFVVFFLFGLTFASAPAGGDFVPAAPCEPGDPEKYLQISADGEGFDTWRPVNTKGGYRYGPSMILNADGSLDVWSAANGPGDIVDVVTYKRLSEGGAKSTGEVIALKPTADSYDWKWTCDPGVIRFGGYYYIGYTTTLDERGVANVVCVARGRTPTGPFEKWTGEGWGVEPAPLIEYTGNPECFGVGEPSFVVVGDTLYIYYTWADERGASTRVATADATDENWPATLVYHGECIPPKNGGDSADVKYVDEYGRFVAVFTEKRFSDDSYVAVWESFDGLTFRPCGFVKADTAKKLHNCGISGRADGHIGAGDTVYLSYAYGGAGNGEWGNWATRMHTVTLSLSDAPFTDDASVENADITVERKNVKIIPEVMTVKAENQVYRLTDESVRVWAIAFDADGYCFPVLSGVTFDGYDPSVVRIVGSRIYPVGEGRTRVYLRWHGFSGDFVVYVDPAE